MSCRTATVFLICSTWSCQTFPSSHEHNPCVFAILPAMGIAIWALPGDKHFRSKYRDFLLMQSLTRREMLLSCMRWSPQRDLRNEYKEGRRTKELMEPECYVMSERFCFVWSSFVVVLICLLTTGHEVANHTMRDFPSWRLSRVLSSLRTCWNWSSFITRNTVCLSSLCLSLVSIRLSVYNLELWLVAGRAS